MAPLFGRKESVSLWTDGVKGGSYGVLGRGRVCRSGRVKPEPFPRPRPARMWSCCHPPLAGQNPIHHQPMPACAGSRLQPFRIQLRRNAVKAQPCGPQCLHTLDYGLFAVKEAVGLAAFATAFFDGEEAVIER